MALTLSRQRSGKTNTRDLTASLLADPRYELIPLRNALDEARALPAGSVVTVTSSPKQGTEATVALAEELAHLGYRAVPHLAARLFRDEIELGTTLKRLEDLAVKDVFVVGGDEAEPAGPYPDGLSLLQAIDRIGHGFEQIGVPSYPEGHHSIDEQTLWQALHAKQAYATYTVTQLCFHSEPINRFAAAAHARGITLPVIAGVPGVVDPAKLLMVGLRVGVGDSMRFLRNNASVARRLLRPSGYKPDGLVRKISGRMRDGKGDIAGLHLYTFNRVGPTATWVADARRRSRRTTRRRSAEEKGT